MTNDEAAQAPPKSRDPVYHGSVAGSGRRAVHCSTPLHHVTTPQLLTRALLEAQQVSWGLFREFKIKYVRNMELSLN